MLALGGYQLFELVQLKGELGALIIGMLLSKNRRSKELSNMLLNFKDIFLIGFFLSIGLTGLPSLSMCAVALLLALLLPLKGYCFFAIMTKLRLPVRTAFLNALLLSSYSEFSLIVLAVAAQAGWIESSWLTTAAVAVAISFVISSVSYRYSHIIYAAVHNKLKRFATKNKLQEDNIRLPQNIHILVIGMGRMGRSALLEFTKNTNDGMWGMDVNQQIVATLCGRGLPVFVGDGESVDLWEGLDLQKIQLIMLAIPKIEDCTSIAKQVRYAGYKQKIAAIARHDDQRRDLRKAGIDTVYNLFNEAGIKFAEDSLRLIADHAAVVAPQSPQLPSQPTLNPTNTPTKT